MKNENIILAILAALVLFSRKGGIAGIGNYPSLENVFQADVINGYVPAKKTLKEATFKMLPRRLEKLNFPGVKSQSDTMDALFILQEIDKQTQIPTAGDKFVFIFLNRRNEPMDYAVFNEMPTVPHVLSLGLKSIPAGMVGFYLTSSDEYHEDSFTFKNEKLKPFVNSLKANAETVGILLLDFVEVRSPSNYYSVGSVGIGHLKHSLRRGPNMEASKIDSPEAVRMFLKKVMGNKILIQELFIIIYLDKKGNPLAYTIHSIGSNDATLADTKIIFATAHELNAKGLIISHNHPSGADKPSNADLQLTEKIQKVGALLDITIKDHVIVTGGEKYFSFREKGYL